MTKMDSKEPNRLSRVLGARMRELGISQTELSARLGVRQQTISEIVAGNVAAPRKWKEIARELRIPEEEMRTLMIEAGRVRGKNTRMPRGLNRVAIDAWSERRLPVYGQAVGGDLGEYIFNGDVIDYVPCPPMLDGVSAAYGLYVDGESMAPRYMPGELVYVHPSLPPRTGNDVVVQIRPPRSEEGGSESDDSGAAPHGYIKRYVGYTPTKLVLEQYNPAGRVEFDRDTVVSVHVVVGRF